ncbi:MULTISPECIES: helix-turn-helix domain-containing protein [unclassified Microbacterium]|uniref:helix-turn-helix domain-containing protein n=1 Tax=unclassified Microbacterium TaxID=2609290 RepID=UPI00386B829E
MPPLTPLSPSRLRLLRHLQEARIATAEDLSARTGLHANTVRDHLRKMASWGWVVISRDDHRRRGRPRYLYAFADGAARTSTALTDRVARAAHRGDLIRRMWPPLDSLLPEQETHQLDALSDHLEECGIDLDGSPERDLVIHLSPCIHDSAESLTVHLRLMQAILRTVGGRLQIDSDRSRCTSWGCIVALTLDDPAARDSAVLVRESPSVA